MVTPKVLYESLLLGAGQWFGQCADARVGGDPAGWAGQVRVLECGGGGLCVEEGKSESERDDWSSIGPRDHLHGLQRARERECVCVCVPKCCMNLFCLALGSGAGSAPMRGSGATRLGGPVRSESCNVVVVASVRGRERCLEYFFKSYR